jgi:hypothetical protein
MVPQVVVSVSKNSVEDVRVQLNMSHLQNAGSVGSAHITITAIIKHNKQTIHQVSHYAVQS